jgi:polar amino acid transport system substrate-binding protein
MEGVNTDACDVSFLGIDPARSAEADFSPAYVEADLTYLVPANSFILSITEADQPGVRIGMPRKDLVDILLS